MEAEQIRKGKHSLGTARADADRGCQVRTLFAVGDFSDSGSQSVTSSPFLEVPNWNLKVGDSLAIRWRLVGDSGGSGKSPRTPPVSGFPGRHSAIIDCRVVRRTGCGRVCNSVHTVYGIWLGHSWLDREHSGDIAYGIQRDREQIEAQMTKGRAPFRGER